MSQDLKVSSQLDSKDKPVHSNRAILKTFSNQKVRTKGPYQYLKEEPHNNKPQQAQKSTLQLYKNLCSFRDQEKPQSVRSKSTQAQSLTLLQKTGSTTSSKFVYGQLDEPQSATLRGYQSVFNNDSKKHDKIFSMQKLLNYQNKA